MLAAVLAIVLVAPFERALFTTPGGVTLTTVEVVIIGALAACIARQGRGGLMPRLPPSLLIAGGAFGVTIAIAALAAPIEKGNAIRFVARMVMAALIFAATLSAIDTRQRARVIARTFLAVASLVAFIATLEAFEVPAVMNALTVFRPGFHVVAGQLRATSTLFYPTIASMYLELAFACGLWLLLDPSTTRPRLERVLAFAGLVVVGAGISATFTRAGLLAMMASLVIVAALRLSRVPRRDAGVGTLTALATVLIGVVFVSHSPELLATRLTTEGTQAWYGAEYDVPDRLAFRTGHVHRIPITVTNTGRMAWDSSQEPAFFISYHWLEAGTGRVVEFNGQRTAFPSPVVPGERVSLAVNVIAPGEPGDYILVWDVVHETRAWLSTEGVRSPRTAVTVTGPPSSTVQTTTMERLPPVIVRPARPELWAAALRVASAHPWLGIGPDNFRHAYGPQLGMTRWDHRVHANNMYLEVLTGAGVIGLTAFILLVASIGAVLWRRSCSAPQSGHVASAVALALWVIVAGHGLVDSFLSFTTTYAMFAVAAGLALSRGLIVHEESDADCV